MIKYECYLSEENGSHVQFASLKEAEQYVSKNPDYLIRIIEEEESVEDQTYLFQKNLLEDIQFGEILIKQFLLDNRTTPQSFSVEDNMTLLSKFQPIEKLARLGDIKTVEYITKITQIDSIFTQERKDKYLLMIEAHFQRLS